MQGHGEKRILIAFILLLCLAISGCGGSASSTADHSGEPRDNTPVVLSPSADGDAVYSSGDISIDASNTDQGYVMVRDKASSDSLVRIAAPDGTTYTYYLTNGSYQTLPLTSGDGTYDIQVMNGIGGNSYILAYEHPIDVKLTDEFLPFLYPNQYAFFVNDSKVVDMAKELSEETWSDLEVVEKIYAYTTTHIAYDDAKAKSVETGYIPDVDETLSSGKGICFDYASLMTAMLRSQRIPTRLEVGYSGDAYHAWISTYIDEIGWVDNVIQFDGENWSLMDPTLAANNDKAAVKEYVGDGTHYVVKYSY